jgi:tyrosyl-tRNA synthetase
VSQVKKKIQKDNFFPPKSDDKHLSFDVMPQCFEQYWSSIKNDENLKFAEILTDEKEKLTKIKAEQEKREQELKAKQEKIDA